VDRFLEHSRVYYFENGCRPEVFVASADWMPRNFFRRIEVAFPVEDGLLRERLITEVLGVTLADNVKARILHPNGTYQRVKPRKGEPPRRSQHEFMARANSEGKERAPRNARKTKYLAMKVAARPPRIGGPKASGGER
jgi:polyphosphate kinase